MRESPSPDRSDHPRSDSAVALESRSGLDPWASAELPEPPQPKGLGWLAVVGPGIIVLGLSIGTGEFLLGPAVFVRHGFTLLWVVGVSVLLQTVLNMETLRYTVATGEPVVTGFMRTRPTSSFWAWFYAMLYFLQIGWPAWAANAAGALFFLGAQRLAGPEESAIVYAIGVGTFLLCVAVLLVGRRIERTLELVNWVLVVAILGGFVTLAVIYVPADTWLRAAAGFAAYDTVRGVFDPLPEGLDYFLLAALVAYSGCGGVPNLTITNWARDKGYGMGSRAGYIAAAVGGQKVQLAHRGFVFKPDAEAMRRWRGWWRIVRADQWGVFFIGALFGMVLPALLYVTFIPAGTDIRGPGISAVLAESMGAQAGPWMAGGIALLGAWILLKSQLDTVEALTRSITDILWTGSRRVRAWRGGDVRAVYYSVLVIGVSWGVVALGLAAPVVLLQVTANVGGVVLVISSLHVLYVNTRLLPVELRPPLWRRLALVFMALFYGFFVALSLHSILTA